MIFENLFPVRSSYGRGSGYTYDTTTGLLTVDTSRTKPARRYTLTAIPHGWRCVKLDAGTDATETHYNVSAKYECDCKGFVRWATCCHADAIRDLDEAGYLEHGEERPETPHPTPDELDLMAAARWETLAEELAGESELLTTTNG